TPVGFFVTEKNSVFNVVRSTAQYFMDGSDLSLNFTRVRTEPKKVPKGFTVQRQEGWIPALQSLLRTGIYKHIDYFHPEMSALCDELNRDALGYVVAQPRFLEMVLQHAGAELFKRAGAAVITPIAEAMDPAMREAFASVDIPVRAN